MVQGGAGAIRVPWTFMLTQRTAARRAPSAATPPSTLGPGPLGPVPKNSWGVCNKSGESGLRSAPRTNKSTQPLTRPARTTKSSAKDLSLRAVKLQYASWLPGAFDRTAVAGLLGFRAKGLFVSDYDV